MLATALCLLIGHASAHEGRYGATPMPAPEVAKAPASITVSISPFKLPYHAIELTTEFRTSDTRSFSLIGGMGGLDNMGMSGMQGGMQGGTQDLQGRTRGRPQDNQPRNTNADERSWQDVSRAGNDTNTNTTTNRRNDNDQSWQGNGGRISEGMEGIASGMNTAMTQRPYWEIGAQAREYVAGNFDNGLNLGGQFRYFKTTQEPGDNSTPERAAAFGPFLGVKMTLAVFSLEAQAGAQVIYDTQQVSVRPMMNVMAGLSF